jgi:hypothetical protein
MSVQFWQRSIARTLGACTIWFGVGHLSADVITLKSGRNVQGKVISSSNSKTVSLRTTAGTLIVFDRQDVKNVKRGASPQSKPASGKPSAKPQPTPEEQAWMPKVRALFRRASSADPDQRRQGTAELLQIDDPNAIPALARYLAGSADDATRRFFSTILRNIYGPKAVYCLVWQSLFDRSPNVRDAARKAISSEQADAARTLYIEALKTGNLNLASLAAKGIQEIGDPNGDSVPYLIDSLIFKTVRVVVTSQPTRVMDSERLGEINYQNQLDAEALAAANAPPVKTVPLSDIHVRTGSSFAGQSMGGSPLGYANVTLPPLYGPMFPPMFGAHNPQIKDPAIITSAPVTVRDILNTPVQYSTGLASEKNVNPAVSETLTQITGQQLGNNVGNWRRWWANQLKNRSLQKSKTADRVISKSSTSPAGSGSR